MPSSSPPRGRRLAATAAPPPPWRRLRPPSAHASGPKRPPHARRRHAAACICEQPHGQAGEHDSGARRPVGKPASARHGSTAPRPATGAISVSGVCSSSGASSERGQPEAQPASTSLHRDPRQPRSSDAGTSLPHKHRRRQTAHPARASFRATAGWNSWVSLSAERGAAGTFSARAGLGESE
jgi:hypothetical protein